MSSKLTSIKEKIEEVYNGDPWYGDSIMSILESIKPEAALKKVNENAHNIAELVAHILSYREFLLNVLTVNGSFKIDQEETFNIKRIDQNEKTVWNSLLKTFEENHQAILKELDQKEDDILAQPVKEKPYNVEYLIEGLVQHDIYHLGQISLLRKLIEA